MKISATVAQQSADPILEFAAVTLPPSAGQSGLRDLSFRLLPGSLMLVQVEPGNEQLPLADAAAGLLQPTAGRIVFLGASWAELAPDRELALRAQQGRVFDGHGWISNLNVLENLTLSQRHHTRRPLPEIIAEVVDLARAFGLSEVPRGRPAAVPRRDLRRAEWIRAFLGRPALILLERPLLGVAMEHAPRLLAQVQSALACGSAVLMTHDQPVIGLPGQNCLRFRMRGDRIFADAAPSAI